MAAISSTIAKTVSEMCVLHYPSHPIAPTGALVVGPVDVVGADVHDELLRRGTERCGVGVEQVVSREHELGGVVGQHAAQRLDELLVVLLLRLVAELPDPLVHHVDADLE